MAVKESEQAASQSLLGASRREGAAFRAGIHPIKANRVWLSLAGQQPHSGTRKSLVCLIYIEDFRRAPLCPGMKPQSHSSPEVA